ncbi:putative dynein light intermediate chain [Trypanosoma theileri]|uniref:Cytoplasmic dynein 2 light intermediate chain 1 n=1 Tax=Trypanosoma theileri TaxID=67003 RepID=A0A1X0NS84_9TRYP|nr:putative dynein light intermediate chain [Trypanosoma theileri]ORC87418.1 putative dynein light intermediate chain [Trypanosoma theileri]
MNGQTSTTVKGSNGKLVGSDVEPSSPVHLPVEDPARDENASPVTAENPMMPQVVVDPRKDLWQNIALNTKDNQPTQTEINLLVVGTSGGGKTSVLHRIFSSISTSGSAVSKGSVKLKPTTALDYTFARRTDRHVSQIAHLWELAQGTELSQLCDVVITPDNIHSMLLMIVVDCSDPSTMWETVTYWLKRVDRRMNEIMQKMRAKGSTTPDKLINRCMRTLGVDHPDKDRIRIPGLPIVIVCNKLDAFAGDMPLMKTMVRSMRFLAHLYGAYLIFTAETDASKLRALMNHLVFLVPFDPRLIELDPERGPVLVLPDTDTFADIGDPTVCDMSDFRSTGDAEIDRWKAPFDSLFPPKHVDGRRNSDPFLKRLYDAGENGFGEPAIDAMRKQKDDELEQYRKGASKREKNGTEEKEKGKGKSKKEKEVS